MPGEKIPCPQCGEPFTKAGLPGHKRFVHGREALEKRIAQLEDLLKGVKEGEAVLADSKPSSSPAPAEARPILPAKVQGAETTEEERLAILGDWLEGMTKDAWVKIGEEAGYFDEVEDAPLSDPVQEKVTEPGEPAEKPTRTVYLPNSGLIVKVK